MGAVEGIAKSCPACGRLVPVQPGADRTEISIVVPVYNESDQIARNAMAIRSFALQTGLSFQLVVIDDGSTDDTWTQLENLRQEMPELIGLRLSRNFGKEAAISAGLNRASGHACLVMDSDLQHPPALIPEMVRLWRSEGWEIVEGVKSARGKESPLNSMGARLFYGILFYLSGYNLGGASDFKLLDRKVVAAWQDMRERNTFFRGMITWLGYRRKQIPFEVAGRQASRSRWSLLSLLRLAIVAITGFSSLPLQIVSIMGGLFLLGSAVFSIYALYLYFTGLALPGFTTVILLELIIGGVLMVSLGIIGTYIARIYEEAKHRPRYLVSTSFDSSAETGAPSRVMPEMAPPSHS
jgi:polyisoprenyl-phosphate glycosyltransferase